MKQIIETKMVEQTTVRFVACDGKEFSTEYECETYERRMNYEQVEKRFKALSPICIPFMLNCDDEAWCVTVHNYAEFDTCIDYCCCQSKWMEVSYLEELAPNTFPYTFGFYIQGDFAAPYTTDIKAFRGQLLSVYDALEGKE